MRPELAKVIEDFAEGPHGTYCDDPHAAAGLCTMVTSKFLAHLYEAGFRDIHYIELWGSKVPFNSGLWDSDEHENFYHAIAVVEGFAVDFTVRQMFIDRGHPYVHPADELKDLWYEVCFHPWDRGFDINERDSLEARIPT